MLLLIWSSSESDTFKACWRKELASCCVISVRDSTVMTLTRAVNLSTFCRMLSQRASSFCSSLWCATWMWWGSQPQFGFLAFSMCTSSFWCSSWQSSFTCQSTHHTGHRGRQNLRNCFPKSIIWKHYTHHQSESKSSSCFSILRNKWSSWKHVMLQLDWT